jgi:hypothetical protein
VLSAFPNLRLKRVGNASRVFSMLPTPRIHVLGKVVPSSI